MKEKGGNITLMFQISYNNVKFMKSIVSMRGDKTEWKEGRKEGRKEASRK